jgi:hypothetical protein
MKHSLVLLLSLIAASLFSCKRARATPEEDFWNWFKSNEDTLFNFEKNRERTFDKLGTEMHKLNPSLTFEFGPIEDGKREFVISADGIKDAFPEVEALYAAAPSLPRWKFIKFRPRRKPMDVNYGGVSVPAASVKVQLSRNGQLADLTVFIPTYSESKREAYTAIAFLLLDGTLGEYDVETRVGQIQVGAAPKSTVRTFSLETLPNAFDALFVN